MARIVHFSTFFRYMEEAEHALWRAAGLAIARPGETTGWPRVAAAFDFQAPLRFEEEFEVVVRVGEVRRRTIRYDCTIIRGQTRIGTGTITTAFVSTIPGQPMKSLDLPPGIVDQIKSALG